MLVSKKYSWCGSDEMWEHVILCKGVSEIKQHYITDLRKAILKGKWINYLRDQIEWILNDIKHYLEGNTEYEDWTTLSIVRIKHVFRA